MPTYVVQFFTKAGEMRKVTDWRGVFRGQVYCIWQNFSHFKIMLLHLDDKISFLLKEYYVQ